MKLLFKLSTQKTRLPILNTILVKNGMALGTDIDSYISHPCDKPDGLYDAHKAKIGIWQEATDRVPEDFPAIPNEFTNMDWAADGLPVESLKWVSKAMSDEESRYYLCGVYFDIDHLVATNGHILKRIEQKGPLKPFIMPDFMVDAILSSGSDKYSICFNGEYIFAHKVYENGMVEYAGNSEIQESFGKLMVSRPPIDIGFNCEFLARGDIAGLAYFGDARDPLLVFDDKKTFVIMPVRL